MDGAVINDRMHSFDPNNAVKEGNVTKVYQLSTRTLFLYGDAKFVNSQVPLNETASAELMDHWMQQAVSGLMAALASRRQVLHSFISTFQLVHQQISAFRQWQEWQKVHGHTKRIDESIKIGINLAFFSKEAMDL